MVFDAKNCKLLRQRLGWSVAEMARRMGCSNAIVTAWENGEQAPDPDVVNQMRALQSHLASYSDRIAQTPIAEKVMREDRLSQVTHRELTERK